MDDQTDSSRKVSLEEQHKRLLSEHGRPWWMTPAREGENSLRQPPLYPLFSGSP